jgi:AraC family transcriptional regulator of adaptative response/methylated-DNA-[protein]-cysteine methyltransferase
VVTDHERWQAVVDRDAEYDGAFVFAVRTTKVYCRPSCRSRRAKRANVRFYAIPEAAEAAGFRACRRCRPQGSDAVDPGLERVRRVCHAIDQQPESIPRLAELAASVGVSSAHLQRSFKQAVGISPREYAEARRLGRLKRNLRRGRNVSAAQYETGLSSSSRLYERAPAQLGMTPATYQRGGKGASIAYGFTRCPLGELLVAATARGICAVMLGERRRALEQELQQEFPEADIRRDDRRLDEFLEAVVGIVQGEGNRLDLPLDIQATAFQWRVWKLLREIPTGETRSYGELAKALGVPGAARAVGRACATNPVALVIPCHRVLRGDGDLGGYRWGPGRKRKLLEVEQERAGV